jgi:hypothetical protein
VLRFGVLFVVAASLGGVTPSLAQSLESQGYRFNRAENVWVPIPAYMQARAEGDADFVKFLNIQGYYFNTAENTWKPLPDYLQRPR